MTESRRHKQKWNGVIRSLQDRLMTARDPKVKQWWERYLKGEIAFRGVPMGAIRAAVHEWWNHAGIIALDTQEQKELALALIREPHCEDKLAGILALQEKLLPTLGPDDVPRFATLFTDGHIQDWNTCDWFCVKVLGNMIASSLNGKAVARAIAGWRHADSLWQRRAAAVAFVNLAKQGETNFPGFTQLVLDVCAQNVRSPERFLQTGVGWVLRELALAERIKVVTFARKHLGFMSTECFRYVTEKMPKTVAQTLRQGRVEARRQRQ